MKSTQRRAGRPGVFGQVSGQVSGQGSGQGSLMSTNVGT